MRRPPHGRRQFIDTAGWTFAKTMPDIPHEYTVRGKATGGKTEPPPTDWHDWFVDEISRRGYPAEFAGRTYVYLEFEGYKYWALHPVINREPLPKSHHVTTRKEPDST